MDAQADLSLCLAHISEGKFSYVAAHNKINTGIYPKHLDRQAWDNRVEPDQTPQNAASDQGLYTVSHLSEVLVTST